MIRLVTLSEQNEIFNIINDAAVAYKGVIPNDRYHEPYMSREELANEWNNGVIFWGCTNEANELIGVMGLQDKGDVSLIRHAYVRTTSRNQGIGGKLLTDLMNRTEKPVLIGTWASASWAIRFYKNYGFRLVTNEEKEQLLRKYWDVSERQIEWSVVLTNDKRSGV